MKLTRRQLRHLIEEAYKTGIPYRGALEQSDSYIARNYPEFEDALSSVDTIQRNVFKSSLDPNRPEPDFKIKPIDDPRNNLTQGRINDIVDEYFSNHPQAHADAFYKGETLDTIAISIFEHCLDQPGNGMDVLYDENGRSRNPEDVRIVIDRYRKAVSRLHHRHHFY